MTQEWLMTISYALYKKTYLNTELMSVKHLSKIDTDLKVEIFSVPPLFKKKNKRFSCIYAVCSDRLK